MHEVFPGEWPNHTSLLVCVMEVKNSRSARYGFEALCRLLPLAPVGFGAMVAANARRLAGHARWQEQGELGLLGRETTGESQGVESRPKTRQTGDHRNCTSREVFYIFPFFGSGIGDGQEQEK